ncbi:MAG: hypothetical protein Unbinned6284contig1004_23 [Prokaryotic dsDNA virus sp.]|nr:MAG: hypothetical protein Unbinned6284contig1004_23 [Prokaryotic dsDNA virus sp.]|tara:strand:+ start:30896 stop:31276 length:381 start_codon:yes stop_codon:yes gene_type:complete
MLEKDYQQYIVREIKKVPYLKVACIQNEVGSNNVKLGAFWKSMGKMAGFSDLMVFNTKRKEIVFLEMKSKTSYKISPKTGKRIIARAGGKQEPHQELFQEFIEDMGFKYFLVGSEEQEKAFFDYIV